MTAWGPCSTIIPEGKLNVLSPGLVSFAMVMICWSSSLSQKQKLRRQNLLTCACSSVHIDAVNTKSGTISSRRAGAASGPAECQWYPEKKDVWQTSLSAFAAWTIAYRSLRASNACPTSRFAQSGELLTVTSLKGPFGAMVAEH